MNSILQFIFFIRIFFDIDGLISYKLFQIVFFYHIYIFKKNFYLIKFNFILIINLIFIGYFNILLKLSVYVFNYNIFIYFLSNLYGTFFV